MLCINQTSGAYKCLVPTLIRQRSADTFSPQGRRDGRRLPSREKGQELALEPDTATQHQARICIEVSGRFLASELCFTAKDDTYFNKMG